MIVCPKCGQEAGHECPESPDPHARIEDLEDALAQIRLAIARADRTRVLGARRVLHDIDTIALAALRAGHPETP